MTNLIGNQSKLEGFFKRKLPPAADDDNNNGDTSRARRDGDVPAANTNCTIQRTSRIDAFSTMKIVKTILRNRIGDGSMNDYIICFVEQGFFATIPIDDVIVRFHKMEDRNRRGTYRR